MILKSILHLKQVRASKRKLLRNKAIIAASGFFDADWYLRKYPEIRNYSRTPLDHYVEYGIAEGRAAGPRFDTLAYVTANPDVIAAGYNPLVHYIRHGEKEGRSFAAAPARALDRREKNDRRPITFSLVIGDGEMADASRTIDSILAQEGIFCEVILTGGLTAYDADRGAAGFVSFSRRTDPDNHNAPLSAALTADCEFVIFLDAGDVLAPQALSKLSRVINATDCDLVYADETQSRRIGTNPATYLKPAWSPELLSSFNYFGHPTAIRRDRVREAFPSAPADLPSVSGEAAEWDLNLRVSERTQLIERLPEVLCHRLRRTEHDLRLPKTASPDPKAVLTDHFRRRGHTATLSVAPDGTFRATWSLAGTPLVSIIIPNRNRAGLLRTCTDGILDKTAYKNIELIIVDNASTEPDTLDLYEALTARSARIVPYDEPFNYSRACNLGASVARGEMLLFLNNDIEVVQADWLDHLVRQASEPGIGVVGAKLLYPDGGIQHAGVALGLFTLAAHVFHRTPQDRWGPFGSPDTQRNWSAVTGACQLVRKSLFDLVSGYDERFILSYSDVVFCLEIARMGFRSVYLPSAVLVHHEGASRGLTNPHNDQVLFAKQLRSLAIAADPYFHPHLNLESFEPKLADHAARTGPTRMQVDIGVIAGAPERPVDPHDFGAIASAAGMPWGAVAWPFDPADLKPGADGGVRIVLEFIARRRDLRKRFPTPIQDGAEGGLAEWIKTEGLSLLGLGAEHAHWIDAAFASNIGGKSRQILTLDPEFRENNPLYLLPEGRAASCARLFDAYLEGHTTREDIWWFLFAMAESAQAALCATWATTPVWQAAVPDGGTVFGIIQLAQWASEVHGVRDHGIFAQDHPTLLSDAAQVRLAYATRPNWQAQFPAAMIDEASAQALLDHLATRGSGLPFLPRGWVEARRKKSLARDIVRPGVNILGHFAYPSGLRISTESLVEGLRENAVAVSARDVPVSVTTDDPIGHRFQGFEIYDTTLIHVQPEPLFDDVHERAGLWLYDEGIYRIGYWYWEFDEVPASWNRAALSCDELWTATQFIADGLRERYRQPIHVLTPGIEIPVFQRMSRSRFGIPDDEFVFVFVFHMTSVMDRKNPIGLIQAFRQAFDKSDKARLIIKTSFGARHPEALAALKAAACEARIDIIDAVFTRDETLSLIDCSDSYVSLHRSEGFGLTMAEGMLLGKPVVATRYSGNLDFMDDDNSLLVDFRLIQLDHDIDPYKAGLQWAEPSIGHAAVLMRRLFDQPTHARAIGARAKSDLEQRLSYRNTGRSVANRLAEIGALGRPARRTASTWRPAM
ncbi:hypothetical protein ASF41_15665 [Methylobacterium sp. Leaf111]|uniref:glycosyltransferase n=1 Tax=Methylobacterium sp. Leaf111 TaxID=1736257 RepID=UPI000701E23D|nr:glycosyltransferase [Methylobacterium sp. Leaf111]KQP75492.1 hypothetical protein ASF41_15665 [Methylobacterium sp. Leaf111]